MRKRLAITLAAIGWLNVVLFAASAGQAGPWRVLFDGHDTSAWRGYLHKEFPKDKWVVEDGCLHLLKNPGGGNELITVDTFDNFEFEWEWKLAPKGNNGVKYFVTDAHPEAPGHEYQMVDDTLESRPKHITGSFYDVLAPKLPTGVKPLGEWNQSRLVVAGNQVEHWLNGAKVLSYEIGSDELKAALADSKFKKIPNFGQKVKGHVMLTSHYTEAWYRNIRVRALPAN